MIERKIYSCPKCKSKLRAIINNEIVCIGIGCDYIYRKNVIEVREGDETIASIEDDWR
jgi:hypothetical protein